MGAPGVPSSSLEEMPDEVRSRPERRLRYVPTPFGAVFGSEGDCNWIGGEKGAGLEIIAILDELALRARSFSARCARKKISSGDSCREISGSTKRLLGVGAASVSVAGGDGSRLPRLVSFKLGESKPLAKKLGIGSDEGAGEAWKVAPAKAAAAAVAVTALGGAE